MAIGTAEDNVLLEACLTGDVEAFGILVQRYQAYICSLTLSAVGDIEQSEEIAQQTFVLAWQKLAQLRDLAKFRAWLSTIARHEITRHFQKAKSDTSAKASSATHLRNQTDKQMDPADQAISREEQALVRRILAQIPEQYREPLILYYREGKSVKEVARCFEITEVNAKKRLSRARAMVKDRFEDILERSLSSGTSAQQFSAGVLGLITVGGLAKSSAAAVGSVPTAEATTGWLAALWESLVVKIAAGTTLAALVIGTGSYLTSQRNPLEPAGGVIQTLPPSLQDGLVLHFSFDTPVDPNRPHHVPDLSPAGNHGVLQGGSIENGFIGRALHCDADRQTDGIIVKDHDSLDLDAVTIAAWIQTQREDDQWCRILDKDWSRAYNLCVGGEFRGETWRRDRVHFECARRAVVTSNKPVTDGRWHLVAGSYDGREMKLYIDGELEMYRHMSAPRPLIHTETDLRIGQLAVPEPPPYDKAFFDGLIDEVRIYNRVLTDDEIKKLYRYRPGAWISLFNGHDLKGWRQRGGRATYAVENGEIVGVTVPGSPNSFLCTKDEFRDFELQFEVKLDARIDSGVQIRSATHDNRVYGYQVEIDPTPRAYSGAIFDEGGGRGWLYNVGNDRSAKHALKPDQWNQFHVLAVGNTIKTWVNGVPIADLQDSTAAQGFIGLQVRRFAGDPPAQVRWRNLLIREITVP